MSSYFETFDDFVDDTILSDLDLLKGELDVLLMQHVFQSFYLEELYLEYPEYYDYITA